MPTPACAEAAVVGGGAGSHRADAEQRADDRHRLGARQLLAQALLMAACDMAGLVGDHADDLVRRFGRSSAPVLMNMRRPATKALKRGSLTRMMSMPDLDRPAALKIGRA